MLTDFGVILRSELTELDLHILFSRQLLHGNIITQKDADTWLKSELRKRKIAHSFKTCPLL